MGKKAPAAPGAEGAAAPAPKKAKAPKAAATSTEAPRSIHLEFKVGKPAKAFSFFVHATSEAEAKSLLAGDLQEVLKQLK